MAADRPTATGAGPLGGLGLGLWVIGLIIGLVVALEHDPDAADFRDTASPVTAVVTSVDATGLTADASGVVHVVPLSPERAERFEAGDMVRLLVGADARLEDDVPASPRRTSDFAAPIVILLLGAALVTADPAILYPIGSRDDR